MARFQARNFEVSRVLSVFSKETDGLIAEHALNSFDLLKFKQHFGVPEEEEDTDMVCEYDVGPNDVEFLSRYLAEGVSFDFDKYAYALSCYRVDNLAS